MAERVIPLIDQRAGARPLPQAADPYAPAFATTEVTDLLHRPLRDLRISVTDRCNFRCSYCMPKEVFGKDYAYLPQSALLSFEEITRTARIFVGLGVRKIRLTGGEPLLRKNIERLIELLANLRTPGGETIDITLTTNGSLLRKKAQSLKDAGLRRLTVSLDGLNDTIFRKMNDVDFPVRDVLDGIEAAQQAGLGPVKVNMVVKRGTNHTEVLPMAKHFRGSGATLRFIEYMDVGATNGWRLSEVVPSEQLVAEIAQHWPIAPLAPTSDGETARRYGYLSPSGEWDQAAGELGFISSVTQAFCGDCNRIRLSTEGQLYLCLFATHGHDLRSALRAGASDSEIRNNLATLWSGRNDRYSELRAQMKAQDSPVGGQRRVEMSYIGG